jgi:hypothetical protein
MCPLWEEPIKDCSDIQVHLEGANENFEIVLKRETKEAAGVYIADGVLGQVSVLIDYYFSFVFFFKVENIYFY